MCWEELGLVEVHPLIHQCQKAEAIHWGQGCLDIADLMDILVVDPQPDLKDTLEAGHQLVD